MKKKLALKCILILVIFVIGVLLVFLQIKKYDYVYAESSDGEWSAFLVPQSHHVCQGFLVYNGKENGDGGSISVTIHEGKERTTMPLALRYHSNDFPDWVYKRIIKEKNYYLFMEFGENNPNLELLILWQKDGEQQKSDIHIKYDRWNYFGFRERLYLLFNHY